MDDLSDLAFEANGLFVIFAAGALVMYLIYHSASSSNVLQSLAYISPWLASNAKSLAWVALGMVFVIAIAIPPMLVLGKSGDGESRLAKIGFVSGGAFSFRSSLFFYRANCLVPSRGLMR